MLQQSLNQVLAERARRRSTALHEAGHAVVGYFLGETIKEVHLSPAFVSSFVTEDLRGHLASLFAGEAAVYLWFGEDVPATPEDYPYLFLSGPSDFDLIEQCLTDHGLTDPDARRRARVEGYAYAEVLVEQFRDAIYYLANYLEVTKDVEGIELEQIFAGWGMPRRQEALGNGSLTVQ